MISADRMAAVDRNAAGLGVPQKQLMESSGNAIARQVRALADPGDAVTIVGGRGNNGGDAFVAARFLDAYDLSVILLGRPEGITTTIARENWQALQNAEYAAESIRDSSEIELNSPDVLVDAILGTGITGAPREPERTAIAAINTSSATVLAVDVPSGLNADTGEAPGIAVDADHVVTFHDMKPGLETHENVQVADIGIPEAAEFFTGPGDLLFLGRATDTHKGDFGRIHVIGGGPYTGAPALAAQAALRGGADLAYVAAPEAVAPQIQGYSENLIVESYPGTHLTPDVVDQLLAEAAARDVVIVGPGIGEATETLEAVRQFLAEYEGRAVVDADALAVVPEVETAATLICTPHGGELEQMGGPTRQDWHEQADQLESFAASLGHTLLLKGVVDVISDGETTRANRTGNPGMTVGGTGDVLAGLAGSLLAVQSPMQAAAIAAYANGAAGDRIVDRQGYGLVASDLLDAIPPVLWRTQ